MELLSKQKILVVAAHSDDEVLGVGGTILKAKMLGSLVDVLIVTDGASSQYQSKAMKDRRQSHLMQCCDRLGVDKVTQFDFPDMRLDKIEHIELNKAFENYLADKNYDLAFVHHPHDINKDHRIVFESFIVAARPTPQCRIKNILTYYVHSSTEWSFHSYENFFRPNLFVDISQELDGKLEAFSKYEDEIRNYPHPRSMENIKNSAFFFGAQVGIHAAEPFNIIRYIQ